MKAILTKYLGPTETKGSRCKAIEPDGKSITIPWNSELFPEDNHRNAAFALIHKMHWLSPGGVITASIKGYQVHVMLGNRRLESNP